MSRLAFRRRDFAGAAQSALEALQRLYHYPMAHFLLGTALTGLRQFVRAAEAFRTALSLNPNFPEAHLRLARLLRCLRDPVGAENHLRLFQEFKLSAECRPASVAATVPRRDEPGGTTEPSPFRSRVPFRGRTSPLRLWSCRVCRARARRWSCRCWRRAACQS